MNRAFDEIVTVIEGPDGGGKTTLAGMYAQVNPPTAIVHTGPPTPGGDVRAELLAALAANPGRAVFDRFHLGEQVYGPLFRGGDALGREGRLAVEAELKRRRAVVVLAMPPFGEAHAAWFGRKAAGKEMFVDRYREVYDAFQTVETDLPFVIYDYTAGPLLCVLDEIAKARRHAYGERPEGL